MTRPLTLFITNSNGERWGWCGLHPLREIFLADEFEAVQDDCLSRTFCVVGAEDKYSLAVEQEGVHIGDADVGIADDAHGISGTSRHVVEFDGKHV